MCEKLNIINLEIAHCHAETVKHKSLLTAMLQIPKNVVRSRNDNYRNGFCNGILLQQEARSINPEARYKVPIQLDYILVSE